MIGTITVPRLPIPFHRWSPGTRIRGTQGPFSPLPGTVLTCSSFWSDDGMEHTYTVVWDTREEEPITIDARTLETYFIKV